MGIVGALLIVWLTETRFEALIGVTFLALGVAVFLPLEILAEWHYWGGMLALMLVLGAYQYGPSRPTGLLFATGETVAEARRRMTTCPRTIKLVSTSHALRYVTKGFGSVGVYHSPVQNRPTSTS